jgi:hypothetical protein
MSAHRVGTFCPWCHSDLTGLYRMPVRRRLLLFLLTFGLGVLAGRTLAQGL